MQILLAVLKAIAVIPKIGELLEVATRELSRFFTMRRYRKQLEAIEGAEFASTRAITAKELKNALLLWHRLSD